MHLEHIEIEGPIHFQNAQWAVTDYGLECLITFYEIDAGFLLRTLTTGSSEQVFNLSQKRWVDLDLFGEALKAAITHHHPAAEVPFDVDEEIAFAKEVRERKCIVEQAIGGAA